MKWWDWSDPAFTLAFITLVTTVTIPIGLWKVGKKGSEDTQKVLSNLEELVRSQRLSYIMDRLKKSRDSQEITQLGEEVADWPKEADKKALVHLYWSNPVAPLPKDLSDFSEVYVGCIMGSLLERCRIRGNCSEDKLKLFIESLQQKGFDVSYGIFAEVYTDPESALDLDKNIGYSFYQKLVKSIPDLYSYLIEYADSRLQYSQYDGFKFNILSGVLAGGLGVIEENKISDIRSYKNKLIASLADQMYSPAHCVFSGIGNWDLDGHSYAYNVTMLAAWLIDTIGFLSDEKNIFDGSDQHCLKRIVESLPRTVEGIYSQARKKPPSEYPYSVGWKDGDKHVHRGVEALKDNQPSLWGQYGQAIEAELDKIGTSWRNP